MNKYQKALKWVKSIHDVIGQEEYYQDLGLRFGQGLNESIKAFEELVDKETNYKYCDNCTEPNYRYNPMGTETEYCSSCAIEIDWSDEK